MSILVASAKFPQFKFTDVGPNQYDVFEGQDRICTIRRCPDGTFSAIDASDCARAGFKTAVEAVEWASSVFLDAKGETPAAPDFGKVCTDLSLILTAKNAKYGNSFAVSGDFLRLLWPNGCKPEDFDRVMLCARMFDKMKRLAVSEDGDDEDPLLDLAGYAVLGLATLGKENDR